MGAVRENDDEHRPEPYRREERGVARENYESRPEPYQCPIDAAYAKLAITILNTHCISQP